MAHGINLSVVYEPPVVIVKAAFAPTEMVVDATVTISLPGEAGEVFQRGRTDLSGNFAFIPDREGEWIYLVDDEQGHQRRRVIEVSGDFFAGRERESDKPEATVLQDGIFGSIPPIFRVVLVFSLLFGITGIYYGLKAGKVDNESDK